MAKRKGYATPEQQAQANKRYYESSEEAVLKHTRLKIEIAH